MVFAGWMPAAWGDELRFGPALQPRAMTGLAAPEPLPPPGQPQGQAPGPFTADMQPPVIANVQTVPGAVIDERPEPLLLAEVLQSVLTHYPLLQAVERERGVAAGRFTTAQGAFDTNVAMSGNALAPGTYENYRADFGLTQQFMFGGITAFGGYRTVFWARL